VAVDEPVHLGNRNLGFASDEFEQPRLGAGNLGGHPLRDGGLEDGPPLTVRGRAGDSGDEIRPLLDALERVERPVAPAGGDHPGDSRKIDGVVTHE